MNIREEIVRYKPFNEQEQTDKKLFLEFIDKYDDVLTRNNRLGHFSASAFVINQDRNKMAMIYHNIYNGWIFPGGHADGENDLLGVAMREVFEETGLIAKVLDDNIFGIWAGPVKGHIKRGNYVSSHIHFDVIYLLQADDTIPLTFRIDESKGAKWVKFENVANEEVVDFVRPINKKLVRKLEEYKVKNYL